MNIAGFASFGSCYSAFHPFGGAVDIIVVEQKDGSYRSTPWYVRFGKFQGVLKGAEKMVRISVNGVEAAFHMYLDNAGEAYFIREVASEKDDDISEVWVLDSLKAHVEDVDNGNERSGDDSVSVCGNESNVSGAEDVQFSDDYVLLGTEKCVVDHNNSSDAIDCKNTECIFRSSSELSLERYVEDVNSHDIGSPCIKLGFRQNSGVSQDNCPSSIPYLDSPSTSPLVTAEVDTSDSNALTIDNSACAGSDSVSLHSMISDPEWKDELTSEMQGIEPVEPQIGSSKAGIRPTVGLGFEISRCGKLLHTGMGSRAADEAFEAYRISAEVFKLSASSIIKEENLIVRFKGKYFLWDKAAPLVLGMAAFGLDLLSETNDAILVDDKPPKVSGGTPEITSTSGSRWRLWPLAFRGAKTVQRTTSNLSNEVVFVDSVSGADNQHTELASSPIACNESPCKKLFRTKIPTTQQIASLNLKDGQNIITFSFSSRVLGTQKVDAHIYLWKWNARIVISDVDGTITKSDVLGQVMPLVGKDWTQTGVARLFSAIKENGYELLFLSARAIVQAYLTRTFLLNLKQDGNTLPNGPVVISPDGLFPSLYREVIRRAPHEFKIPCLEDNKALFPSDYNPFYAGFGNRATDELSYTKIGIPKGKIFIINPKGELANHRIGVKSYTYLHTLVDDMFPPTSMTEQLQEEYNSWNYWRTPLPNIDI